LPNKKAHLHNPKDNVAVALADLEQGDVVEVLRGSGPVSVTVLEPVPFGHKLALDPITLDGDVTKYGGFIGKATKNIAVGEHVHTHNIKGVKYT
jgi:altronate dehydratase small subunit